MAGESNKMIVILRGDLGDQITMLPAAYSMIDAIPWSEPLEFIVHPLIRDLLPETKFKNWVYSGRSGVRNHNIVVLDIWDIVETFGKSKHPSLLAFDALEIPNHSSDPTAPQIKITQPKALQSNYYDFDFLIFPCANDPIRAMPVDFLDNLVTEIRSIYGPCQIGMMAGEDDLIPVNFHNFYPEIVSWYGLPLSEVAYIMRSTKRAVITVDSMPNRLAHAAGIENHILLCSDVVPLHWAMHPKAKVIYGSSDSWKVDDVLRLIDTPRFDEPQVVS